MIVRGATLTGERHTASEVSRERSCHLLMGLALSLELQRKQGDVLSVLTMASTVPSHG